MSVALVEVELSADQRENLKKEAISRLPVGIFGCRFAGTSEEDCDYHQLWEAPLEDWYEPKCPDCFRSAFLVEVADEHQH